MAAENQFPAYYFHPTEGQRLFGSEAQLKEAGAGWVDSTSKFPKAKHPVAEEKAEESRLKKKAE